MNILLTSSVAVATPAAQKVRQTLVVFDSRLANLEQLYRALAESAIGHTIAVEEDGIEAITKLLVATGAENLAIVAHGEPGIIHLGSKPIDREMLVARAGLLAQWEVDAALRSIAIYACETGSDQGFTSLLGELTGAEVWAATGKVGPAALGGTWELTASTLSLMAKDFALLPIALQNYPELFGTEFLVNTTTVDTQDTPTITALSGGGFVVAWQSYNQDGSSYDIYGQRYNSAGIKQGSEFQINTFTNSDQYNPSIAALNGGGFVVTWQSYNQDGSSYGVYGQRYDANGVSQGVEFRVNSTTAGYQSDASVIGLSDGGFVATWNAIQSSTSYDIYGQRYDSNGIAQGSEFLVNTTNAGFQLAPSIGSLSGGGFIIAWGSDSQDGSSYDVYGQRFNSAGVKQGSEFRANTTTANAQDLPAVTGLSDGGYLVTWQSSGQDGSGYGIYGQRYDANGVSQGSEFRINTTTLSSQSNPAVTSISGGGFVVTWQSYLQDGDGYGVYGQRYDNNGISQGAEFLVNTTIYTHQYNPSVTALTNGNVVVAWQEGTGLGNDNNILASIFSGSNNAPTGTPTGLLSSTPEDTPIAIQAATLLSGFSDVDGDTLSIINLIASDGTLIDNNNGSYTFSPIANFNGIVNLTYEVTDGQAILSGQTRSFNVISVNDAPNGSPTIVLGDTKVNTPIVIQSSDLLAGFSDVEEDSLSVVDLVANNGTIGRI